MMRRPIAAVLALLLIPAARGADEKDKPDATALEDLRALERVFQEAQQKLAEQARMAKTDDERATAMKGRAASVETFALRFQKLAAKHPQSPAAVEALLWVMTNAEMSKAGEQAAETLAAKYLTHEMLRQRLPRFVHANSASAGKLLRAAAESSDAHTRAVGSFVLGQYLKNRAELPGQLAGLNAATLKQIESIYGKSFLEDVRKIDPESMRKEAETFLETVETKYADVKLNNRPLGEQVKPVLYELRNLSIGKVAPDIEGEDLDGTKFKLSDYRGKVVVIDFWGNW